MNTLEQLKISIEEYNKLSGTDLVAYMCRHCKETKYKKKSLIQPALDLNKYIFCSNACGAQFHSPHKMPPKEELEILIKEGMSSHQIAEHLNRSQCSIRHWLKKYGLKTKCAFRKGGMKNPTPIIKETAASKEPTNKIKPARIKKKRCPQIKNRYLTYDWKEIQNFYDTGKTWDEIQVKFNVSINNISTAKKLGLFKSRTCSETYAIKNPERKGKKLSDSTKQKIRIARLNYLAANPDKVSWKSKDKFKSVPCEKIKNELKLLNIPFIEELMPLIDDKRFFAADIALPEKMIMFEINGGQHYDTSGNLKPYYQERHDLIQTKGWTIYEIPYHSAMRDNFVNEFILPIINGAKDVEIPKFYIKNSKPLCSCGKEKFRTSLHCRKCSNLIRFNKTIDYQI